jgi:hypothetical protein
LSEQLFEMLNEMSARYPEKDPQWTQEAEEEYLKHIVNVVWPRVENQRMQYLSEGFEPGNNWWGSKVED